MESCATCKYVHKDGKTFVCRRYPPQSLLVPMQGSNGQALGVEVRTALPAVDADFYCGEYVAKMIIIRNAGAVAC